MLTEHDRRLSEAIVLTFPEVGNIEFQFPPKVVSDSRKGSWIEKETMGVEPIAIYATSQPRRITLQITYINDGSEGWNHVKISKQVRSMRGYFQRVRARSDAINQVIYLKLWSIGGGGEGENIGEENKNIVGRPLSFRLLDCSVKYGETMIMTQNNPNTAWPLRADITLDLASWTQGQTDKDTIGDQSIDGLNPFLPTDWY